MYNDSTTQGLEEFFDGILCGIGKSKAKILIATIAKETTV